MISDIIILIACTDKFYCLDFDNGLGGWNNGNNYQSRGNNMGGGGGGGMRGNMDMGMKGGGNYRGGNDNWNCNNGGGMHCVHMRGLPFRASEQDIADVNKRFFKASFLA